MGARRIAAPGGATNLAVAGVSCVPNRACVLVGGFTNASGQQVTLVERWQHARWSIQHSANYIGSIATSLNDVSCASRRSCMAVGSVNPVEHWDGYGVVDPENASRDGLHLQRGFVPDSIRLCALSDQWWASKPSPRCRATAIGQSRSWLRPARSAAL